eukprot:jgi/Hompol1/552/HPOL_000370-RA
MQQFSTLDFFDRFVRRTQTLANPLPPLPSPIDRSLVRALVVRLLLRAHVAAHEAALVSDNYGGTVALSPSGLERLRIHDSSNNNQQQRLSTSAFSSAPASSQLSTQPPQSPLAAAIASMTPQQLVTTKTFIETISSSYHSIANAPKPVKPGPTQEEIAFMNLLNSDQTFRTSEILMELLAREDQMASRNSSVQIGSLSQQGTLPMYLEYSPKVVRWIGAVLGIRVDPSRDLMSYLRSGDIFCRLACTMYPRVECQLLDKGPKFAIHKIIFFLELCKSLHIKRALLFTVANLLVFPDDDRHRKYALVVLRTILALEKHARKTGWTGPALDLKGKMASQAPVSSTDLMQQQIMGQRLSSMSQSYSSAPPRNLVSIIRSSSGPASPSSSRLQNSSRVQSRVSFAPTSSSPLPPPSLQQQQHMSSETTSSRISSNSILDMYSAQGDRDSSISKQQQQQQQQSGSFYGNGNSSQESLSYMTHDQNRQDGKSLSPVHELEEDSIDPGDSESQRYYQSDPSLSRPFSFRPSNPPSVTRYSSNSYATDPDSNGQPASLPRSIASGTETGNTESTGVVVTISQPEEPMQVTTQAGETYDSAQSWFDSRSDADTVSASTDDLKHRSALPDFSTSSPAAIADSDEHGFEYSLQPPQDTDNSKRRSVLADFPAPYPSSSMGDNPHKFATSLEVPEDGENVKRRSVLAAFRAPSIQIDQRDQPEFESMATSSPTRRTEQPIKRRSALVNSLPPQPPPKIEIDASSGGLLSIPTSPGSPGNPKRRSILSVYAPPTPIDASVESFTSLDPSQPVSRQLHSERNLMIGLMADDEVNYVANLSNIVTFFDLMIKKRRRRSSQILRANSNSDNNGATNTREKHLSAMLPEYLHQRPDESNSAYKFRLDTEMSELMGIHSSFVALCNVHRAMLSELRTAIEESCLSSDPTPVDIGRITAKYARQLLEPYARYATTVIICGQKTLTTITTEDQTAFRDLVVSKFSKLTTDLEDAPAMPKPRAAPTSDDDTEDEDAEERQPESATSTSDRPPWMWYLQQPVTRLASYAGVLADIANTEIQIEPHIDLDNRRARVAAIKLECAARTIAETVEITLTA